MKQCAQLVVTDVESNPKLNKIVRLSAFLCTPFTNHTQPYFFALLLMQLLWTVCKGSGEKKTPLRPIQEKNTQLYSAFA